MSNRRGWKLLVGTLFVLAVFALGVERLMRDRLEQGDVYAEYSTFRADPIGAKALYDVLEETPGLEVSRYTRSLEKIDRLKPGVFFYLGDSVESWEVSAPEKLYLAIERWMREGGRMVVTLAPERSADSWSQRRRQRLARESEERAKKEREEKEDKPKESDDEENEEIKYVDLHTRWKINVGRRELPAGQSDPASAAEMNWPELPWQSVGYFRFAEDSGWKTIASRNGDLPVVVERKFEKGSLVLVSDTYLLTNEGLWLNRHPEFLSWLIGDQSRVYFDEQHLGVVEQEGVATLARRYGLFGGVYMLVLLAVLFIWRNARSLAPAFPETTAGSSLGEESSLGLVNLLKRAVPPASLIPLCISEWVKTSGVARRIAPEVESIWQAEKTSGKRPNVPNVYRQIQQLLRKRRVR